MKWCSSAALALAAFAIPASASTFSVVYDTAAEPVRTILQAPVPVAGGRIIGQSNGFGDLGQVYELTPAAAGQPYTKKLIHTWPVGNGPTAATDGTNPSGNLTPDAQGNLWGTTNGHGANATGTLFELMRPVVPAGTWRYRVVLQLPASLGVSNSGGYGNLIFDTAGNLYALSVGGTVANGCYGTGCGAIWKIPAATLVGGTAPITTLVTIPYKLLVATSMIRDASGDFFGVGNINTKNGVAWEASAAAGKYGIKAIHYFCALHDAGSSCKDGNAPSGIVITKAGVLYGTTYYGGACDGAGVPGCNPTFGVVFSLRPAPNGRWAVHVVHTFNQVENQIYTADIGISEPSGLTLSGTKLLMTMQYGGSSTCRPGNAAGPAGCSSYEGGVLSMTAGGVDSIISNAFGDYRVTPPIAGPLYPQFAPILDSTGAILGTTQAYYTPAGDITYGGVIYRITK